MVSPFRWIVTPARAARAFKGSSAGIEFVIVATRQFYLCRRLL
jgi:hypothetical protein